MTAPRTATAPSTSPWYTSKIFDLVPNHWQPWMKTISLCAAALAAILSRIAAQTATELLEQKVDSVVSRVQNEAARRLNP
jgi:hypothetical protein